MVDYEERISNVEKDVTEIKTTQSFLKEMLNRNTETNEKLVDTLHKVEQSMISINDNLQVQSKEIGAIRKELDETTSTFDKKLHSVKDRINEMDEEGKFNIRTFFKNYFPWIVIILGMGLNFLSKFFKF